MNDVRVRQAGPDDVLEIAGMCAALWPEGSEEEHAGEVRQYIETGRYGTLPAVFLLAQDGAGTVTGFLHVSMRSHADGCDPEQPVGFIEGWFVKPEVRGQGLGAILMHTAENWAREHGCRELASDTWMDHLPSQQAHQALGFEIVDRCVHFRKSL
ncbi:MAG TPA: GNAT family N-acetyltransferase [Acidobacteriaceae bacterium]|jgi:aminoglycoside 6'-N-acetyltransferase I